jgi:hypothetical protein
MAGDGLKGLIPLPHWMRCRMLRKFLFATALAIGLLGPALAADPQTFKTEDSATKFCKAGNVVWYNPTSKIYFEQGTQYYNNTKVGGFTCRTQAEKAGYRASKK